MRLNATSEPTADTTNAGNLEAILGKADELVNGIAPGQYWNGVAYAIAALTTSMWPTN